MTEHPTGKSGDGPDGRDVERVMTERWFVRRGVPHFIEDYSASEDVLTRAAPILVLVFLFSAISAIDLAWPLWGIVAASLVGLAILVGVWSSLNRMRGRPLASTPERIGGLEIGVFLLVPTTLPLMFGGDVKGSLITFVTLLAILLIVYAVTSYALVSLTAWAAMQLLRTLGQTFTLFVRGLPLLLIGFMFLFINAEAWQTAGTLDRRLLVAVACTFAVLAAAFLVSQIPTEVEGLDVFESWTEVDAWVAEAPADKGPLGRTERPNPPGLSRRETGNLWLVFFVSQGLRLMLVSLLVGLLFVGLGILIIQPETIALWTGRSPEVVWAFSILGRELSLTTELLQVSGFLAAFAAVYFSVYAATDQTLHSEFFEGTVAEVRQSLAVRVLYRA